MGEREKLIELIQNAVNGCARHWAEVIADHLLSNGVIVPPCKGGDTVYCISKNRIEEASVGEITISTGLQISIYFECDYDCLGCPFSSWGQDYSGEYSCRGEYGTKEVTCEDFGKTVFLTKEEAEAKLKERSEGE